MPEINNLKRESIHFWLMVLDLEILVQGYSPFLPSSPPPHPLLLLGPLSSKNDVT
jgi:hypothetical protein